MMWNGSIPSSTRGVKQSTPLLLESSRKYISVRHYIFFDGSLYSYGLPSPNIANVTCTITLYQKGSHVCLCTPAMLLRCPPQTPRKTT